MKSNGQIKVGSKWLAASVKPAFDVGEDLYHCVVVYSEDAQKQKVVGLSLILPADRVQLVETIDVTVKEKYGRWFVCLSGTSDLTDLSWSALDGGVQELPDFIPTKLGRVFEFNGNQKHCDIRFTHPVWTIKLNAKSLDSTHWMINGDTLVKLGFVFQRSLMNNNLLHYIETSTMEELCHNIPVIMSCIKAVPFWMKRHALKLHDALAIRLKDMPQLEQFLHFEEASNILPMQKKRLAKSSVSSWSDASAYSDSFVDDDSSFISTTSGSFYSKRSSEKRSSEKRSSEDISVTEFPDVQFWAEFATQKLKKGQNIQIPLNLNIADPFQPDKPLVMCKVLKVIPSATNPLLLQGFTCDADDALTESSKFLLKAGDDLRQDVAVLQAFEMMNSIWAKHGVRYRGRLVQAKTYKVIPITNDVGIIEYVPNCKTLQNIGEYEMLFDDDDEVINLIASACGSYIASYILGVRDRHWDNVLIQDDGTVFHVDFGFCLGAKPTLDASPFAITKNLHKLMGNKYQDFISMCMTAIMVLKSEAEDLINFSKVIFPQKGDRVNTFLAQRLGLNNEDDVVSDVRNALRQAPSSWATWTKNRIHEVAKNMKH